eukprot:TRINITY_DN19202_c0_g1_i1.p1 TRINITY_DN19202_c0_g1~~TRINITY_DN19202_c0_g1_i1.p1  ORF type:complete len:466 (+),score=70.18 TRINITY_DN19202_c0_g1_i1:188-1399(+)
MLQREIAAMKQLNHPNVLRLVDVMETAKHFYLVIELATGGELLDQITDQKRFNEDTARSYFQQLILGVQYCHKRGIVHRDLKPQNLLLTNKNKLKIADFGFSNFQCLDEESGKVTPTLRLQTCCGTPNYAAPEIFMADGYNGFRTDIWSCGVILYVMLTGSVPFKPTGEVKGVQGIILAITRGQYRVPSAVPAAARDMIQKILTINPSKRYTISDIMNDPWFLVNFVPPVQQSTKVAQLDLSDDVIRQSIKFENEEEIPASNGVSMPSTRSIFNEIESSVGVEKVFPLSPPNQLIGAEKPGQADLSDEVLKVLPHLKDITFDEHGRQTIARTHNEDLAATLRQHKSDHEFSKQFLPGLCFYCGKFIYGKGKQCKKCRCPVHVKCVTAAEQHSWCEQYLNRVQT